MKRAMLASTDSVSSGMNKNLRILIAKSPYLNLKEHDQNASDGQDEK